ncbi:rhodanese-like domain-containing protein [Ectothiorhodospiraceae bacterium 2226]|nr:rhodanese-like domain-containing protein [Ectothiorhodospiraceae bacterium 2226]
MADDPGRALRFSELVQECERQVREIFPWDLLERREAGLDALLLDVREPAEFEAMHVAGSINVPRGILESACEYGYEETRPELVEARQRDVVVLCRSGKRSVLAAHVLGRMGYLQVVSLKTGLRGWHEYEQPLVTPDGRVVDEAAAEAYFTPRLTPEQLGSSRRQT